MEGNKLFRESVSLVSMARNYYLLALSRLRNQRGQQGAYGDDEEEEEEGTKMGGAEGKERAAEIRRQCLLNLATCYIKERRFTDALHYCDIAEKEYHRAGLPLPAKLSLRKANALEETGELKKAQKALASGIKSVEDGTNASRKELRSLEAARDKILAKIEATAKAERRKYGGFLNRKWGPAVKSGFLLNNDDKKRKKRQQQEKQQEAGKIGEDSKEPIPMYPDKNLVGEKTCELCGKKMPCKQWARHMLKYHNPDSTGDYESSDSEGYPEELTFPPLPDGTVITY
eukprot:jgi/Bigna1/143764/aug1.81_g18472